MHLLIATALLLAAEDRTDYGTKLSQTLGSTKIAHMQKDYKLALEKITQLETIVASWKTQIVAAREAEANPPAPEEAPQPPAESVEFFVNTTFEPKKCSRRAQLGATMKVQYVGKLFADAKVVDGKLVGGTKSKQKIFASSFHTGSLPYSFKLGSSDVVEAWNKGLEGMCEGERRRLIVPWNMAHGAKGTKGVPPYSDVQYDLELVELSNPRVAKNARKDDL